MKDDQDRVALPREEVTKDRRSYIFDRIHRSPRIPDRYADRRAVSR